LPLGCLALSTGANDRSEIQEGLERGEANGTLLLAWKASGSHVFKSRRDMAQIFPGD
jgi:hypothetical protein